MIRPFCVLALPVLLALPAPADDSVTKRIQFDPGASSAVVSAELSGRGDIIYKVNAREGQFLQVMMLPGVKGADFNIFIPGRKPGDEALYVSATGGRQYLGQLYKTGDHSILVYQNRAAARRGDKTEYKMLVRITNEKPEMEEAPATGPVPGKVLADCLAALREKIPDRDMKVVRSERGENSFIVDIQVDGVEKVWRCYHDGTRCTGTEYQGEG